MSLNLSAFKEASLAFHRVVIPWVVACKGSIISGQRSIAHNKDVGGVKYSLHLIGCAMDVQFDTTEDKMEFASLCEESGLEVVVKNTVVHVEMDLKSVLKKMVDKELEQGEVT